MKRIAGFGLFWAWNVLFVSFVGFGLGPFLLPSLIVDAVRGRAPASLAVWTLLAIAVPLACSGVALTRSYRSDPRRLLTLLFAVEGPLFLSALVRLFAVREANAGLATVGAAIALSAAVAFADLHLPAPRRTGLVAAKLAGHAASLVAAVHLALWALFYAVPAVVAVLGVVFSLKSWGNLLDVIVHSGGIALLALVAGIGLLGFSASLLGALPFVLPWLHNRALRRAWEAAVAEPRLGVGKAAGVGLAAALAVVGAYGLAAQQPQGKAFALLEKAPGDDGERARLVAQSGAIRAGLVNAYLASYRYAGAVASDGHIRSMYESALGLERETAEEVQRLYALVGWPLHYQGGAFEEDRRRAQERYEGFFDEPIEQAERAAIRAAAITRFDRGARETGLADVAAERVLLARQELVVEERGDWADLELHEVYENQTEQAQEVLYYFHLPGTAVLTGLWLGDTDDRTRRFPFAVAPRGAAQAVYREEVGKRRDPALLEQVGPRQYRLRVFPVPERPRDGSATPRMHLWMTFKVLAEDGRWPLPRLAERRNVFWDRRTERALGGAVPAGEGWLPLDLAPRRAILPVRHQVTLAGGHVVSASPVDWKTVPPRAGLKAAVVVDTSRSMEKRVKELREARTWIERELRGAKLDLYLASGASSGRGIERRTDVLSLAPEALVFYGSLTTPELLVELAAARGEAQYDAVFVLTDGGGQELVVQKPRLPELDAALWMVHLGGELPRGYDDSTLALLTRPGSGIATTLDEAVRRFSAAASLPGSLTDLDGGYLWTMETSQAEPKDDPFAPLAARQLVLSMKRWTEGDALSRLDAVHALAQQQRIVTPYSSMLVLVNDEQRARLAQLSAQADRFEREVESGTGGGPSGLDLLTVSAVPEPHEWVLLAVAGLLLVFGRRFRREGPARPA